MASPMRNQHNFFNLEASVLSHPHGIPSKPKENTAWLHYFGDYIFLMCPYSCCLSNPCRQIQSHRFVALFGLRWIIGWVKNHQIWANFPICQHSQKIKRIHMIFSGSFGIQIIRIGSPSFITSKWVNRNLRFFQILSHKTPYRNYVESIGIRHRPKTIKLNQSQNLAQ